VTRVLRRAVRAAGTAGVSLLIGAGAAAADDPVLTTTVEGVVLDSHRTPVPGAEVEAEGTTLRTVTAEDGRFTIAIPGGVSALRARASGFAEERKVLPSAPPSPFVIVLRTAVASERVTVTATVTPARLADIPASLVALDSATLAATAALTLDDALRQVPGFTLFRRTGSRTANPTAQGVSLRGLGASGASRALVLVDGEPLNDPFGGWVYWGRVPRDAVESVEVLRGAASDLYGSTALGGVVQVITRPLPPGGELRAEASVGNEGTLDGSAALAGKAGPWGARLAAAGFRTDGYTPVEEASRGAVDTEATSSHGVVDLRLERSWEGGGRVFGRGSLFGESRGNGTPLQTNATQVREGALGADWSSAGLGTLRVRLDLSNQVFNQSFTSISANRSAETLTRKQRVPARTAGLALVWSHGLGRKHVALLGLDVRNVKGASDEIAFTAGVRSAEVDAGGRVRTAGVFAQDLFQVSSRLLVVAAARFDHWRHEDGFSTTQPLAAGSPRTSTPFPDRAEDAFSPRVSVLFRAVSRLSLVASGYGAFRGPTLNELYRSFRLGDTLTRANEQLRPERLSGGEAGARWSSASGRYGARTTAFSSTIRDPVANVTLSSIPGLVTRQRQNLGRTRSRGIEAELTALPAAGLQLAAGYALTDARVLRFPASLALEGLQLPQVPRHQLTFQAGYEGARGLRVSLQGRWSSTQYEDDLNRLPLAPGFQLDALAAHRLGRGLEAFAAAENLFNARAEVGLVSVKTLGPPVTVRAGLRLRLPSR
jgi:outer membrane receptor protein involved in Fe transport